MAAHLSLSLPGFGTPYTQPDRNALSNGMEAVDARSETSRIFREVLSIPDFAYPKLPNGRPMPWRGFDWSVSHSKGGILVAVADFPIGADLEFRKKRDPCVFRALHHSAGGLPFYDAWTAAEAVVKLVGAWVDAIGNVRFGNRGLRDRNFGGVDFFRFSDTILGDARFRVLTGSWESWTYSVAFPAHVDA